LGKTTTRHRSTKVDAYVETLVENIVGDNDQLKLRKGAKLFSQGEEADAIYFIQTGKMQVTVVSAQGKRAVLDTLGPRDFLGEGCLVGDFRRTGTATSLEPSTVFRIGKRAMLEALHGQPRLSGKFMASLLARNVNLEEDLCNQLLNHSEGRLARVLLTLSRFSRHDKLPDAKVPKFTYKMLAETVGTTRSKITFFMKKFRKLGLIDYDKGNMIIMAEALTDSILRDELKPETKPAFPSTQEETENMAEIHEEIESERLRQDKEWGGAANDDVHEPEKWCGFLRHQLRLADRAACSLATDEITGGEEQALIEGYRERLIKIAAVAIAAAESLDRITKKRAGSSAKEAELAKRSIGRANRRREK
jgi:CRP/FNR family transcriptional regulator, cyclic AMP receptor protein